MGDYFTAIDQFAVNLGRAAQRYRWLIIGLAVIATLLIGSGARLLEFSTNYRTFFSTENPELNAFENLQSTYTKNDNFLFVLEPADGVVFKPTTLQAIERLTERAWQIPYALRVDSISNFQHTFAEDDDLIVEDLVRDGANLSVAQLRQKYAIATTEPLLLNQLVNSNGSATAVNVVLQYPEKHQNEVPEAVAKARQLRAELQAEYPDLNIWITGASMLNNAFSETGKHDAKTLNPLMFLVIFLITWLIIRSLAATLATMVVIVFSTVVGMGVAGFTGIKLTPIAMSATVVILTLAIADSIHILLSLRSVMRDGLDKSAAITEAIRLNFLPVSITSVTTIVGFLCLNFSDSPPFWHLGNITAVGIGAAWLFSITLLPALISVAPFKVKVGTGDSRSEKAMDRLANFVIAKRWVLIWGLGGLTLLLITFIPTIEFNDQWIRYFSKKIELRQHSDQALKHFGMYPIEFSVPAINPGGVSEPEYLAKLESFAGFLRQQPEVKHVYSISDIMKRLNKNLHADDDSYYRIPQDRELSAQYLLLYELSLPYGLDLNDRINIDKSASRLTATLADVTTSQTKRVLDAAKDWMQNNWPDYMQATPTSAQVMFTYITDRNVSNMITGTIIAILAISFILMIALRSLSLGVLSLIPNGLPILATFGAWALLVGVVGFSVATVASISLGIIVDDTVHFLSKYIRARRERRLGAEDSVRYAFRNVGLAIIVNTLILVIGFLVLTTSQFKLNVDMGLLTAMAIIFALILDFLFLPALLLGLSGDKSTPQTLDNQAAKANQLKV